MPTSQLDQLRTMTTIVVDSGDFDAIKSFAPSGATTNPSLVFQAAIDLAGHDEDIVEDGAAGIQLDLIALLLDQWDREDIDSRREQTHRRQDGGEYSEK